MDQPAPTSTAPAAGAPSRDVTSSDAGPGDPAPGDPAPGAVPPPPAHLLAPPPTAPPRRGVPPLSFPPGWYRDPIVPGIVRYWDGRQWTPWAVQRPKPPRPPHPTLPLSVGVGALVTILLSLVASRYLVDWLAGHQWPIAIYVVIAGLTGYGPVMAYCWWASRRWGRRSLRADAGFFGRWADAGWGPVTWLCCLASQIVLGIVVITTGVPFSNNTDGIDTVGGERGYVISLLVLAVVAAPLVEEIVFRGVVLKSFLSVMRAPIAVAVQAVLFGLAHFDPVRGTGNIGLVIVLSGAGAVLGGAAYLFRRIIPSVIAHAIVNAIAMTIALLGLAD